MAGNEGLVSGSSSGARAACSDRSAARPAPHGTLDSGGRAEPLPGHRATRLAAPGAEPAGGCPARGAVRPPDAAPGLAACARQAGQRGQALRWPARCRGGGGAASSCSVWPSSAERPADAAGRASARRQAATATERQRPRPRRWLAGVQAGLGQRAAWHVAQPGLRVAAAPRPHRSAGGCGRLVAAGLTGACRRRARPSSRRQTASPSAAVAASAGWRFGWLADRALAATGRWLPAAPFLRSGAAGRGPVSRSR